MAALPLIEYGKLALYQAHKTSGEHCGRLHGTVRTHLSSVDRHVLQSYEKSRNGKNDFETIIFQVEKLHRVALINEKFVMRVSYS